MSDDQNNPDAMHDSKHTSQPEASFAPCPGYASDAVEQIFREVAMMTPAPPKDEDPYQSEEYQRFVASMVTHCHCTPAHNRPCDGVLAGGLCDDMHWEDGRTWDDESDA